MDDAPVSDKSAEAEQPAPGTVSVPPPTEASFAAVFDLIALVADPRAARKQLRGYHEAMVAADQAQKNLVAAQTEFSVYEEKTRAELAAERTAIEDLRVKVYSAEQDLKAREDSRAERYATFHRDDATLRRRAAVIAKLELNDHHLDSGLVDMPSWRQLVEALLEVGPPAEPESDSVTRRPDNAAEGTTLMQSFHTPRKSMRRVTQAEA